MRRSAARWFPPAAYSPLTDKPDCFHSVLPACLSKISTLTTIFDLTPRDVDRALGGLVGQRDVGLVRRDLAPHQGVGLRLGRLAQAQLVR